MNKITGRKISCITVIYASLLAVVVITTALSCTTKKSIMTEPLFRQTKRANLGLPHDGVVRDSITGELIVVETVTYENAENSYVDVGDANSPQAGDTMDLTAGVHRLKAVEVKGRSRFTPERDGRIVVDFMLEVPKELLGDNWRVILDPLLFHNDSIIPLQQVILKGSKFAAKQKKDYAEYRKFLESLVLKSGYNDVFLDKKSIRKDMERRRLHYWNKYKQEWEKQVAYEDWRFEREDQDAFYDAKAIALNHKKYAKYALKTMEESNPEVYKGKESIELGDKYKKKFEKGTKKLPDHYTKREIEIDNFPNKYKDNFERGVTFRDVSNEVLNAQDSLGISAYRYFFDKMALNEALIAQRKEIFKNTVDFPYSDPNVVRIDSVVTGKENFVLYYSQDYPVAEGLRNIRITLDGKIQAMDRSTYTMQTADTLSYVISSLVQLVDTSLSVKEIKIQRDAVKTVTIFPKYQPNDYEFRTNYMNNRAEINKVMVAYLEAATDNRFVLDSVIMTSSSSIEGSKGNNAKASQKRLDGVYGYMMNQLPDGVNTEMIMPRNIGEDWKALASLVEKRNDFQNKKDLLARILNSSVDEDKRESEIKFLYRGDYKKMQDELFPLLRNISVSFYMRRPNMEKSEMIHEEVISGYKEGIRLLENREYTKALALLSNFSDYNTALCYACMGYNGTAYQLLLKLDPEKANTQYLLALVCCRLRKEDAAILHLVKACQLDRTKVYRAKLDAETKQLIQKYNLSDQLQEIADKAYEKELAKEMEEDNMDLDGEGAESDTDSTEGNEDADTAE